MAPASSVAPKSDRAAFAPPAVASISWLLALIAVTSVYLSANEHVWGVGLALLALVVVALSYLACGDRKSGITVVSCAVILAPTLVGWQLVVPALGAGVLLWENLTLRPWRRTFTPRWSAMAAVTAGLVVGGVIVFQMISTQMAASNAEFTWTTLPGSQDGTLVIWLIVIGAAAVNALFEEQLWRVALPRLYVSRRWLIVQWLLTSICFGLSHIHGTPGGVIGMAFAGLFGFIMCLIREFSDGSIVWTVPVHFLADVILIGAVYGLF